MTTSLVIDEHRIEMTADEHALVLTALRLLLATLGKDEADEMREIEMLLARLQAA